MINSKVKKIKIIKAIFLKGLIAPLISIIFILWSFFFNRTGFLNSWHVIITDIFTQYRLDRIISILAAILLLSGWLFFFTKNKPKSRKLVYFMLGFFGGFFVSCLLLYGLLLITGLKVR